VGIEALSRGAARVVLVERDQSALRALRANLAALGAPRAAARVMAGDVLRLLPELGAQEGPFDFVFIDPPYATALAARTLESLGATRICRAGTEVIVQHSTRTTLPSVPGLVPHRRPRQFGDTALTFLRAEGYTPDGSRP
jgi:16S rRNA (guanine(966)-N(2))-methyltransferase RsmD